MITALSLTHTGMTNILYFNIKHNIYLNCKYVTPVTIVPHMNDFVSGNIDCEINIYDNDIRVCNLSTQNNTLPCHYDRYLLDGIDTVILDLFPIPTSLTAATSISSVSPRLLTL